MKRGVKPLLGDILECIERIEEYANGVSEDDFGGDIQLQDAIIRRLEIIGEATKNIGMDFKIKYPDVDWKRIAGMRDVLTHAYFGVNVERVWVVIKRDCRFLRAESLRL